MFQTLKLIFNQLKFPAQVPKDAAEILGLEDPTKYTFHSLRRTSASCAADQGLLLFRNHTIFSNDSIIGASAIQLQSHFGWKSPNMAMEYVTKSKAAIKDVAGLLANKDSDEIINVS